MTAELAEEKESEKVGGEGGGAREGNRERGLILGPGGWKGGGRGGFELTQVSECSSPTHWGPVIALSTHSHAKQSTGCVAQSHSPVV